MADRSRIFICYKKLGSDGRESNAAYQLYQYLSESEKYDVWMDEGLDAGILWEKTIYENLISSHVVILAVGEETAKSEWVRRELSIAMAFDIQVVPVGLSISEAKLHEQLGLLGLTGIHYRRPFNMASQTARAIVAELAPAIDRARANTQAGGFQLVHRIYERVKPASNPAKPAISASAKQFDIEGKKLTIHIAAGDIFRLSGFDILVNSENDYMHMARIFDMASLSSNIRHFGSATERGYLEDTIQSEIEMAIAGRPRPLPPATALVTSSGGPTSSLYRNNRISHIVHVAAVQAVIAEHRIAPLRGERQIRDCVASALSAVQQVCQKKGVVSPEHSSQRRQQEAVADQFRPSRVMMPLFGTGRGGQSATEIGPVVLEAVLEFFSGPLCEAEHMPISDVHVSVFGSEDVEAMSNILSRLERRR